MPKGENSTRAKADRALVRLLMVFAHEVRDNRQHTWDIVKEFDKPTSPLCQAKNEFLDRLYGKGA
jgi:hypothetical protein